VDGMTTKAPSAAPRAGPTPAIAARRVPLAAAVARAKRHDLKLLAATLDGVVILRPEPSGTARQDLSLNLGYGDETSRVRSWGEATRSTSRAVAGRGGITGREVEHEAGWWSGHTVG